MADASEGGGGCVGALVAFVTGAFGVVSAFIGVILFVKWVWVS